MNLDPHALWPFYQILVGLGTLVIAVEGGIIAYALWRIFKRIERMPGQIIKLPPGNLRDEIRMPINDSVHFPPNE